MFERGDRMPRGRSRRSIDVNRIVELNRMRCLIGLIGMCGGVYELLTPDSPLSPPMIIIYVHPSLIEKRRRIGHHSRRTVFGTAPPIRKLVVSE